MKDRQTDRFVINLPFSVGCISQSSVDVADTRQKKAQEGLSPKGETNSDLKPKGDSFVARLLRSFKNLSQIFAVFDEEEEEEEREMVISYPTDVKHVAHVGWDGSNDTTKNLKSWNSNKQAPPAASSQFSNVSLPSFSMRQFELAMAAQAGGTSGAANVLL